VAVMRKCAGLLLLLLCFFLVVAFVNPLRQVMIQDDWSYALTVRHLLTTGEYKLHDWAAANMPVQIYWAALLTRVFGYTFPVLYCSTLVLLLVGLIALYWLLRDSGVSDVESSPNYKKAVYKYQRADYLFYNVSYTRNIFTFKDSFSPEAGPFFRGPRYV